VLIDIIIIGLKCSIIGFVYSEILIQQGHLLHGFHQWLTRKLTTEHTQTLPDNTPEEVKKMPGYVYLPVKKVIVTKHWILKPLGDCALCFTGQLALWSFIYDYNIKPYLTPSVSHFIYMLASLIFLISLSILLTLFIKKINEKWSIR
jgi:hypothetical protein